MTDDITLRVAGPDDLEFLFHVLKTSLGPYIEQTYGPWQEEEQRARFFERTKPETHHIVERAGEPIGSLDVAWLPDEVKLNRPGVSTSASASSSPDRPTPIS